MSENTTKTLKASAQKSKNAISRDIKTEVTNRIISILEKGTDVWQKTWQSAANAGFPSNAASGKSYQGINVVVLWCAAQESGYASSKWLTYKQAQAIGGNVRKGERGTGIVFYSPIKIKDKETDEEKEVCMLKSFTVFNVEQIDNLPAELTPAAPKADSNHTPIDSIDALINATGAHIEHDGKQPCYIPSRDVIHMPQPEAFTSSANYYTTICHELAHWTGHETRLDRNLKNSSGSADYAREELCAELAAAFLAAHFGLIDGTIEQHASYLDSWLKVLKEDKNAIFQAAGAAQKAFDYLLKAA